jgi:hypothetical protein
VFVLSSLGTFYRSVNGGRNFTDETAKLANFDEAGGIVFMEVAPGDPTGQYVVLTSDSAFNWFSRDGGNSWQQHNTSVIIDELVMHPTLPQVFIALELHESCFGGDRALCNDQAFITLDFGQTFTLIARYVSKIEFDPVITDLASPAMVLTQFKNESGYQFRDRDVTEQNLYRLDVDPTTGVPYLNGYYRLLLLTDGYGFVYFPAFLFAVSKGETAAGQATPMYLWASTDDGITMRRAAFPVALTVGSQITILDRSSEMIMALWSSVSESWGDVYISDGDGLQYITMINDCRRRAAHTYDFYRARGIAGVFFVNQVEEFAERQYRTRMTTDKGDQWRALEAPPADLAGAPFNCSEPLDCKLHLRFEPNYRIVTHASAVGMVFATGNVGRYASPRIAELQPFVSRDTGVSWRASVERNTYHAELGYHGAVILLAQSEAPTRDLRYTINQGQNWTIDRNVFPVDLLVEDITHHSSLTEETFLVQGSRFDASMFRRVGVLVFVDLEPLRLRQCVGIDMPGAAQSDYEFYQPSTTATGCLLGRIVKFVRRAATAECIDTSNRTTAIMTTPCMCTRDDYECSFGFKVNTATRICQRDPAVQIASPFEQCLANKQSFYYSSSGYRLIPGNGCINGLQIGRKQESCVGVTAPPTTVAPPTTAAPTAPAPTTAVAPVTTTAPGTTADSTTAELTSTGTPMRVDTTATEGETASMPLLTGTPETDAVDRSLSGGAIAGIVIGTVLGAALIIGLVVFALFKVKRAKYVEQKDQETAMH